MKVLLRAHEGAEEKLIRPLTGQSAAAVADARDAEEAHADTVLAKLTALDVASREFGSTLADLVTAVGEHAQAEEREEFPLVEQNTTPQRRLELGAAFLAEVAGATV